LAVIESGCIEFSLCGEEMEVENNLDEALTLEKTILSDIASRTGLSFPKLGGIPTKDKVTAKSVLPIISEWVPIVENRNCRHALYALFNTSHSQPYLPRLIEWWADEEDELAAGSLSQTIARWMSDGDGKLIWNKMKERSWKAVDVFLIVRLAKIAGIREQVIRRLFEELHNRELSQGEVEILKRIGDPLLSNRLQMIHSSELKVAKPSLPGRPRRSAALKPCSGGPDRSKELYSTEIDRCEIQAALEQIAERTSIEVDIDLRELAAVRRQAWSRADFGAKSSDRLLLWIRSEDLDVVEIVVTKG
jgi:hypothetical protein